MSCEFAQDCSCVLVLTNNVVVHFCGTFFVVCYSWYVIRGMLCVVCQLWYSTSIIRV